MINEILIFFQSKGLVLGFYQGKEKGEFTLTKAAQGVQSSSLPSLSELIKL